MVLGVDPHPRKSWVLWAEQGKYPNVIVEILFKSTAEDDRTIKKQLYQDTFRTPEYFWYDPETQEFQGFCLISGRYQLIQPNSQGWLWSEQLNLFLGVDESKLRFFTSNGQRITTPPEQVMREQERANREQERANREQEKANRLAEKLRSLGINPEEI